MEELLCTDRLLELAKKLKHNRKRQAWLRERERGGMPTRQPLGLPELESLYAPYLERDELVNLSPREVRLLETVLTLLCHNYDQVKELEGLYEENNRLARRI